MSVLYRNEIGYHCECDHCGKVFDSARSTAQYCSSKCRVAAHREIEKYKQRLIDFQREAARLVAEMKNGKMMRSETQAALERVAATIKAWVNEPSENVRTLAIHGRDPFIFDKPI
jgi:phage host-nuclease inhibitor protein Gam